MSYVGKTFSTGNNVVAGLRAGSVLRVVAPGQLEVVEVAAPPAPVAPKAGQRFTSKYGKATVVAFTTRDGFNEFIEEQVDEDTVFYIADGTAKVRMTSASQVK